MTTISPPYGLLAPFYDFVMKDVEYDLWAEFLDDIIQTHHPDAVHVHEVACGTGSMTLALAAFGSYELSGSDRSPEMLRIARRKAEADGAGIAFHESDFTAIVPEGSSNGYDVILCVFDSINYILDPDVIEQSIRRIGRRLNPDGIFIFDFTTPEHSRKSIEWLDQEQGWIHDHLFLHRESRFDEQKKRHYNTFRMFERPRDTWTPDPGETPDWMETHEQRPYGLTDMVPRVEAAGVMDWTAYGEFDLEPADSASERITMVCRW